MIIISMDIKVHEKMLLAKNQVRDRLYASKNMGMKFWILEEFIENSPVEICLFKN
jgi:hypothetical protein